jgi:hypothetical protein
MQRQRGVVVEAAAAVAANKGRAVEVKEVEVEAMVGCVVKAQPTHRTAVLN